MVKKGKDNGVIIQFEWENSIAYVGLAMMKCFIGNAKKLTGRPFRKIKSSMPVVVKNKDITVTVHPDGTINIQPNDKERPFK